MPLRSLFLTFRGLSASYDSNPYPSSSRISRYNATKLEIITSSHVKCACLNGSSLKRSCDVIVSGVFPGSFWPKKIRSSRGQQKLGPTKTYILPQTKGFLEHFGAFFVTKIVTRKKVFVSTSFCRRAALKKIHRISMNLP